MDQPKVWGEMRTQLEAAADEVDDFESIIFGDGGGGPGGAGGNGAIMLDGDAIGLKGEGGEEILKGGTGGERKESCAAGR